MEFDKLIGKEKVELNFITKLGRPSPIERGRVKIISNLIRSFTESFVDGWFDMYTWNQYVSIRVLNIELIISKVKANMNGNKYKLIIVNSNESNDWYRPYRR